MSDSKGLKSGFLTIQPGVPMAIVDIPEILPSADAELRSRTEAIGKTIKAYLIAVKELLEGKYRDLVEIAPPHMTSACRPIAFIFPEGILVRYDRVPNPELKVFVGTPLSLFEQDGATLELTLTAAAPAVSEGFLHCTADPTNYDPGDRVLKITLHAQSSSTNESREIHQQRIVAVTPLPSQGSGTVDALNLHPSPFASVRNDFEVNMELEVENNPQLPRRRFLVRNQIRLPVGWEAIDIFPPFDPRAWKPDSVAIWAERDLLAAVLQKNIRDGKFRAIDPNAQARRKMARLFAECEGLLNGNEESLHQFIKANPGILCPTHCRLWSKLPLGKRDTDFVFREPSGDYLLVEIEKPSHLLFRNDGQQREELTHAIDQVTDWRRYMEDNLRTVQSELGLEGISSNPSCLIVIGRSVSLDDANKRKLVALQNTMPKLRIMTYDDLIANAKAAAENILGPLWDAGPGAEVYLLS
jgi:hypothetical protein